MPSTNAGESSIMQKRSRMFGTLLKAKYNKEDPGLLSS